MSHSVLQLCEYVRDLGYRMMFWPYCGRSKGLLDSGGLWNIFLLTDNCFYFFKILLGSADAFYQCTSVLLSAAQSTGQ